MPFKSEAQRRWMWMMRPQMAERWEKESRKGKKVAELLAGGKASEPGAKRPKPAQMAMGAKVEREHTRNPALAREIASDHLAEIPDYYTRLQKMEREAKMGKKTAAYETGARAAIEAGGDPQSLYFGLRAADDSRLHMFHELEAMDEGERDRYLADMSARNHRLAMTTANITAKTAAYEAALIKVAKASRGGEWKPYAAMAALPVVGAGSGAAIKALVNWSEKLPVGAGARRGAGIGGAIGLGAAGLIGLSRLLDKADPSGRSFQAAVSLAPAALAVGGAMVDPKGRD